MTPPRALGSSAARRLTTRSLGAPDRAAFAALARAPRQRRDPVTLRFLRDEALHPPRVAYAVGSNVGGAVRRNRARRRLRAALAGRIDTLAPGSYLLGGGPELVTCPFEVLDARVGELVDAAGAAR